MPRAGWCRDCGEWIWVEEDGSCQNGHGPECVGGIYEADPQEQVAGPEKDFGVGEMPDDLYRFSWAAFTLPFIWGATYGVWPVVMWWLVASLAPIILASALGFDLETSPASTVIIVAVFSEAVSGIYRLWAGVNAHSLLWRRETVRLSVLPGSKPRFSIARFKKRQRTWIIVGWVLLIVALILSLAMNYVTWQGFGLSIAGAVAPLVFMGAEVWLGVWLSLKMVQERPGPADASAAPTGPPS